MTARHKRSPLLVAGILFLVLIPAALLAARHPSKTQAAWFDPNWTYRTKIDVANSSGSTQTDFQVQIATDTASLITAGKMQVTCGDLRVTDNSGKLLNYWVEPSTCNTSATQIWVKVPSIPTSGIPVYLYYGNASASPATYKTTDVFIKELSGSIASWPLDDTVTTQSYARVVNPTQATGRNVVIDGDMETAGTGKWSVAGGSNKMTSPSPHGGSQFLRISNTAPSGAWSYQSSLLVVGKAYHLTGWVRSDGLITPGIYDGAAYVFNGSTSTSWQAVDVNFIAKGTLVYLIMSSGYTTNSGYADYDDITVTQVNVPSSGTATNLLTDGNMETSGTSAWTTLSGTPSKQTTSPHGGSQVIRLTSSGVGQAQVSQAILTVGKVYRVYGYARSDGTGIPGVFDGTNYDFSGTTSTAWQPFDFTFVAASGTNLRFYKKDATTSGYVEFDDVVVTDDSGIRTGELVTNGGFDDSSAWAAAAGLSISGGLANYTSGSTGSGNSFSPLIAGKTYLVTWTISNYSAGTFRVRAGTSGSTGTPRSANGTYSDVIIAAGTTLQPYLDPNGFTGSVDNVSVTEISPLSGTFSTTASKIPTLGAASGGHLSTAYSFNSANSQYVNVYSSDLNSAFNPSEGTIVTWAKVSGAGVWTDGTARDIVRIGVDGSSNFIVLRKDSTNNNLKGYYRSGGTDKSASFATSAPTGWFQFTITWSKSADQVKMYLNGSQQGSTLTGLGTWTGNLVSAYTILSAGATTPWSGLINDVHLYNRALSSDEIASLYSGSVDLQAYTTSNYTGKELVRKFNSSVTTTMSYAEETSSGPAAYWKFDEGNGTSPKDSSPNANTGSFAGTTQPTWATEDQCISGKCLNFTQSDNRVTIPDSTSTRPSTITVEAWVRPTANGRYGTVLSKEPGVGATTNGYAFRQRNNDTFWFVVGREGSGITAQGATTFTLGKWYHLVGTYDGATSKLYVNGVLDGTGGGSRVINATNALTIGILPTSLNDPFVGYIDEVKIFPNVRTAAQILADYNARGSNASVGTSVGLQNTTFLNNGLVGYWKMDEATWSGTASEVKDSSGSNANGQAMGPANAKAYPAGGKFGNGGYFDGVDDYIAISATQALGLNFSMSAWIYLNGNPAGQTGIIKGDNNANSYAIFEVNSSRRLVLEFRDNANGSGGNSVSGSNNTTLSTGTWYLATLTIDRSINKATFYLNGVANGTVDLSTATQTIQSRLTAIGRHVSSFPGYIDEARVYNRTLSAGEISQLYNWAPGPVGYWKMDEGTGTTANDTSGSNSIASFNGSPSPTWSSGKFGKAISFVKESNHYLTAANESTYDFTNQVTVETWINVSSNDSFGGIVSKTASNINGWELRFTNVQGGVQCRILNGADTGIAYTVSLNIWHHVACTYTATDNLIRLYVDGVLQGTQAASTGIATNNTPVTFGGLAYSPTLGFTGSLDDVKVYSYPRTQQQIVEDMNGGHPTGGSPIGSQLLYWKMDDSAGNTVRDSINSYNGTLGGTTLPAWKPGKINSSLFFTARTDTGGSRVAYSTPTNVNLGTTTGTQLTITAWIKPSATQTNSANSYIVRNGTGADENYSIVLTSISGGKMKLKVEYHDDTSFRTVISSGYIVTLGAWNHIAVVYTQGVNIQLFVNGVLTDTLAWVGNPSAASTSSLNIGANPGASAQSYDGYIDDFKIYNSALTADQIKIDYNANAALNYGTGSISEAANDLSDGAGNPPVAYWNFDENTGSSVNDKSGNGNIGSWQGTLGNQWAFGKTGGAGNFNGSNNYVSVADNSSLRFTETNAFTIEAWFKPNSPSFSNSYASIVNKRAGNDRYWIMLDSGYHVNVNIGDGTNVMTITSTTVVPNNQWSHASLVYNGANNLKLYVNSKLEGTATTPTLSGLDTTGAILEIGKETTNNRWFKGNIDEVKIYNYARTASQIAYDYNRGAPIAYWNFDECQGSTIKDHSGSGFDGTWAGGTTIGTCTTPSTAWGNGATGKFNSSLAFNRANSDYINLGDVLDMGTNDWTVSAWFKTSSAVGTIVGKSLYGSASGRWSITYDTGNLIVVYQATGGSATYTITGTWNNNVWHNVVVTFDRDGLSTAYIDGNYINSASIASSNGNDQQSACPVYIGAYQNAACNGPQAGYFFNGLIDDVRIYNYALSANQVKKLFNQSAAVRYGPTSGTP